MTIGSQWLEGVARDGQIRSGLILYGNVRDLFWSGTGVEYLTLSELMLRSLTRTGSEAFTIRASWDRVDGLRFAEPSQSIRWNDAVQRALGGPTTGTAYDLGEDDDEDGSADPTPDTRTAIDLDELLARYRIVLADPDERPLLVLDWSHLLVTQPAHPDPTERAWLQRLGKALVGDARQPLDSDRLRRGSGLVVVVSASLGAVPPVLYQGEPRVRLHAVPAPARAERRAFFARHRDDLRIERPRPQPGSGSPPNRDAGIDTLADLTDQLNTADLRQILALSRSVPEPLAPDRLLNLYRFGDQRSPWEELSEDKLDEVETILRNRVVGQDHAVAHVSTMIIRAWLGLAGLQHSARRSKPKGTLFFVGPTGVGKTELAKATAEFLFGDETACIRFDMSEYNHEHSDQRLVGAPPGYVGFEEGGQLTNAVAERPFSVLLFDEVEKAHPRVLDKFLQILEDGRLTDGRGETAWFSESVIIFTSNIGAAKAPDPGAQSADYARHFLGAVEEHFVSVLQRPELLNRLGDNIVVFHPITDGGFRQAILERKLSPLRDHLLERWGVQLELSDGVQGRMIEAARAEHGGRGILNALERDLMNPLARFLYERRHQLRQGRRVVVEVGDEGLEFSLEGA